MPLEIHFFMKKAFRLARKAARENEVPVGAVIELDGKVIGRGYNRPAASSDPTAHAEIIAMRKAGKRTGNYRLTGAVLYVTLEPCIMCYTAAVHARVKKIVYGASDPKGGVFSTGAFVQISHIFNHKIDIESGILGTECSQLLKNFFIELRDGGA